MKGKVVIALNTAWNLHNFRAGLIRAVAERYMRFRNLLVVEIQYQAGIVWVKFIGTHAQYNLIDVESINAH